MSSSATATTTTTPAVVVQKGQIVSIVTWVLLITSTLSMIARLATKYAVSRRFQMDDVLASLALLCHVGSGVATSIEAQHGLGLSFRTQSADRLEIFAKSLYAADLLYIATVCFAKISIILLINVITPNKKHRQLTMSLLAFIATWSIASFFASAFSCQLPETWIITSKCFDKAAFWYVFGVINIATDMALVFLPMYIMVPLKMSRKKKVMILGCFSARLIDVSVTIVQLVYTSAFRSADFTQDLWPWVLISQFVQCVTIITSCLPYLKPLLESFPSGMFTSAETGRRGTGISEPKYVFRQVHEEQGRKNSHPVAMLQNSATSSKLGRAGKGTVTTVSSIGDPTDHRVDPWTEEVSTRTSRIIKSTSYSVSHSAEHE